MPPPSLPSSPSPPPGRAPHHVREVVAEELRRFLVMFVYLWVLFGLFALHEDVVLREHGIGFAFQGVALVNALVLGKVMLIAEDLRLGHRVRARPLIVPITFESALLALLFIAVHALEKIIEGLIHGQTLAQSIPDFGGGGMQGVMCVAAILFVALIPFFAFRHLSHALGDGQIKAILFGPGVPTSSS